MIHEFAIPDIFAGRELRTVVWDDEAGTVDGTHYAVPHLRQSMDMAPLTMHEVAGTLTLADPAHSAPDFLALLWEYCYSPRLRDHLPPPSLAGVEPTPRDMFDLPEGHLA